jgi:phage shock protein E
MFDFLKFHSDYSETDFKKLREEGAVIIDVRTPAEFNEGHIKGSKNIPLSELRSKTAWIKEQHVKVITVCRSGARSASAKKLLASEGVIAFNGGAWVALNKKLKK